MSAFKCKTKDAHKRVSNLGDKNFFIKISFVSTSSQQTKCTSKHVHDRIAKQSPLDTGRTMAQFKVCQIAGPRRNTAAGRYCQVSTEVYLFLLSVPTKCLLKTSYWTKCITSHRYSMLSYSIHT